MSYLGAATLYITDNALKFRVASWAAAVQEYQFRITRYRALSLFSVDCYFSNSAAIRAARRLRKNGGTLEVWREDACIYRETNTGERPLIWLIVAGRALG